ncbi:putative conserved hypothetical protein [Lysobacter antibioticus]|uniref:Uncharacterized protein n=1 Tax=Lysobacter antibioticus TaxID=84531 RepID=A0A0S2FHS9_LYSAN|nr:putative conserved hypothetical protein [Lysobacter antibioticus]
MRKAESLSWVHRELSHLNIRAEMALVVAVKQLTAEEYDAFARQLLRDRDWLAAFDGICNEVLEVRCEAPGRPTLYVRPEGYNYARYVGLAVVG